ncbi:MAG: hypothetical protein JXA77_12825 [Bacteroidales bacterium]|nr:hypothetical protein [Bacteroidales bacterium]MBN2820476.1 hypothetical protein [Bacteroidales bacterium]
MRKLEPNEQGFVLYATSFQYSPTFIATSYKLAVVSVKQKPGLKKNQAILFILLATSRRLAP